MYRFHTPLLSKRDIFAFPDYRSVLISPNGNLIAWLAPIDDILNIWIAPRGDISLAKPITNVSGRSIRNFHWAYNNQDLIYIKDNQGDENWHLHTVNVATKQSKDLTPLENVHAHLLKLSPRFPNEAIVALNNRKPEWHDLYRVDIESGEMTMLLQNDQFKSVIVDSYFNVRLAEKTTTDGDTEIYAPHEDKWRLWATTRHEDDLTTEIIGFDRTNEYVYMKESGGRNTSALVERSYLDRSSRVLACDPKADVASVVKHPVDESPQAVSFIYDRKRWQVVDSRIQADIGFLLGKIEGELEIISRTLDDQFWIVADSADCRPLRYYLYNRHQKTLQFLFSNQQRLEGKQLSQMHSCTIRSRDGLNLVAYYSLPYGSDSQTVGIPDQPLPLILNPHGGPWSRDHWGFNPSHQWLANRGYAVLSVNFRASTGFGKAFVNAGDLEWGGKIIEDQIDAVQWAIDQKIADPRKIGIMGGSFGGYSALAGLTFYPDMYACGIAMVAPSNLTTLLETVPSYWKPLQNVFAKRVGNLKTSEGRSILDKHSPLNYVNRIHRPLLVAQGANDPRVKRSESDQIVGSMQSKGILVTYALFPDEGHGIVRVENRLAFFSVAEAFLAEHLGGRCEFSPGDFKGSSITLPVGAEYVPGLVEVLNHQLQEEEE